MDIINYLLELIKSRKEIGIDGLGTFYKQKLPGRYDADAHVFLPPSYQLAFTKELKENTALVAFFGKKRNVSEETAGYFISDFAKEVNAGLATNGSYDLQGLGKLSLENDELIFTPSEEVNIGFEFYALPPVNSEPEKTIVEEKHGEDSVVNQQTTNTVEEFTIETPPQPENELESLVDPKLTTAEAIAVENQFEEQNPDSFATDPAQENEPSPLLSNEEEIVAIKNAVEENEEEAVYEEIAEAPTPSSVSNEIDSKIDQDKLVVENETTATPPIPIATKDWDFKDAPEIVREAKPDQLLVQETDRKSTPLYLKFLLGAIILAVVILVLYFVNPSIFNVFVKNDTNPDQKIAIPLAESKPLNTQADSLSFADSIMQNAEKVGLQVDSARDTATITVKAKPVIKKPSITYEVIVAALTKKDVPAFIARLKRRGIVARVETDIPGRLNKISIGSFNNPDSATKYAKQYQKTLKDPTIYSIPVKHK